MTPQEEKIIKLSSEKIKQCLYEESRKYSNAQIRNIEIYVESLINKTIQNYQTNFEQKHIASAVEVAKVEAVRKFIDQEIERKKGMRKSLEDTNNTFEEDSNLGYNSCLYEDIAHLTSLKELIK